MTGRLRRLAALAAAAVVGLLAGLPAAAPVAADDGGYRYWSFWTWDAAEGDWLYATQGPGTLRPGDGDVLGFRFVVSSGSADSRGPREPGDFAAICPADESGEDAGEAGERVALVIDFGTAEDAPGGETPPGQRTACAPLTDGGTAAAALAEVAEPLRYNSDALLCAIAGYPARGCADALTDGGDESAAAAGEPDDGGGSAWTLAAGAGVVALLGVAAVIRARRRRG
jgi:hypothetical protein